MNLTRVCADGSRSSNPSSESGSWTPEDVAPPTPAPADAPPLAAAAPPHSTCSAAGRRSGAQSENRRAVSIDDLLA